jgi:hypothetical protein
VILGVVWPPLFWPRTLISQQPELWLCWAAGCLGCAFFTMLPVDKEESIAMMSVRVHTNENDTANIFNRVAGGVLMWTWAYSRITNVSQQMNSDLRRTVFVQVSILSIHTFPYDRHLIPYLVCVTFCQHGRHSQFCQESSS